MRPLSASPAARTSAPDKLDCPPSLPVPLSTGQQRTSHLSAGEAHVPGPEERVWTPCSLLSLCAVTRRKEALKVGTPHGPGSRGPASSPPHSRSGVVLPGHGAPPGHVTSRRPAPGPWLPQHLQHTEPRGDDGETLVSATPVCDGGGPALQPRGGSLRTRGDAGLQHGPVTSWGRLRMW